MSYQYDLFISFKNSTELGLTEDREVANKFFEALNQNDFKVFFSNAVLSERGIANYMLEIQSALEGSKSILVIFSHVDYISKGWVAQEWMTFLNLLMKDPHRNIYIFSIKNDNSNLPAFLRPYECFGDYKSALTHLTNGLKNEDGVLAEGIGKRDFLNAYWGLFGSTDIFDYIDKPMRDEFYNHEVYCLKSKFLNGGDLNSYMDGLSHLIEFRKNPLASYLLSRYYRDVKHLDLALSRKLTREAYESFKKKVENSADNCEISLWILTDECEYDGAFYMCDVVHDVLDAYDVSTEIRVLTPDMLSEVHFFGQRKIVLFWSDVCIDVPDCFIERLKTEKERLLIALNSFGENALAYDIKDFELFENNNMDITKICRILLS